MTLEPPAICERDGTVTAARGRNAAWLSLLFLVALVASTLQAEEGFMPPQAHPVDRYEAGWNKNPFTLKTAPIALEKASFAQDLAIGTFYGASTDPTVVVINTKTHERIPMRTGSTAANGMTLQSVSLSPSRRDTTAVVTMEGETAVLHFDESFIRQLAAKQGAGDATERAGTAGNPQDRGVSAGGRDKKSMGAARTVRPVEAGGTGAAGASATVAESIPTSRGRLRLNLPTAQSKTDSGQSH
jgi:hypothetical protein